MTQQPPPIRGTRFPGFPSLPPFPDPGAPLQGILKSIQQLKEQAQAASDTAEQVSRTMQEGLAEAQKEAQTRVRTSPFKRPPGP